MAQLDQGAKAAIRAATALAVFVAIIAAIFVFDPDNADLWIKAFHVVAVIAWMAGLLYLPRLFIYHHETKAGSEASELFKKMEFRLFSIIMNPALMIAWLLGLYMAWNVFGFHGGWLHAKLLFVVLLSGMHSYLGNAMRAFQRDERPRSQRHWRFMNEVAALLMIVIVLLVIVKSF